MSNTVTIEDKMEMVGFLRTLGLSTAFVSLRTETIVEQRKFNLTGRKIVSPKTGKLINEKIPNPYLGAIKLCRRNGLVNVNFVNSVCRKIAEATGQSLDAVKYERGRIWYYHALQNGKPLPLCVHKDNPRRFYLQFFPLRNLGRTIYVLNGVEMTADEIRDMYKNWVTQIEENEFKPIVLTLAIDSIRQIKARQIELLNSTVNRIMDRLKNKPMKPAQPPIPKVVE